MKMKNFTNIKIHSQIAQDILRSFFMLLYRFRGSKPKFDFLAHAKTIQQMWTYSVTTPKYFNSIYVLKAWTHLDLIVWQVSTKLNFIDFIFSVGARVLIFLLYKWRKTLWNNNACLVSGFCNVNIACSLRCICSAINSKNQTRKYSVTII